MCNGTQFIIEKKSSPQAGLIPGTARFLFHEHDNVRHFIIKNIRIRTKAIILIQFVSLRRKLSSNTSEKD